MASSLYQICHGPYYRVEVLHKSQYKTLVPGNARSGQTHNCPVTYAGAPPTPSFDDLLNFFPCPTFPLVFAASLQKFCPLVRWCTIG